MSRHVRWLFAILALLICTPATAQYTDQVGIYFDTGYTQTDVVNETVPHSATGYLVLHEPTQSAGGLGGWECHVGFEGYAPLTQWHLAGDAMNFKTEPDFIVGMLSPLPVTGPQVLLASFDMMITEATPFRLELVPLRWAPSIPDAMSYIPWDDKEVLTPMTTVTMQPTVATYNWLPYCEIDRSTVQFGEVPLLSEDMEHIAVINRGGGILVVDPVLTGDGYALTATGPFYIQSGQTRYIGVTFQPTVAQGYLGELDLGTECGTVLLYGYGRLPLVSYNIDPDTYHFGNTPVGTSVQTTIRFFNTGETAFDLHPTMVCPEFTPSPGVPFTVEPGQSRAIYVTFLPGAAGWFECDLELGVGIAPVPVSGTASNPADLIAVYPTSVEFGTIYGGAVSGRVVRLVNTSEVDVSVHGNVLDIDGPFTMVSPATGLSVVILPNGGYQDFDLAFSPVAEGLYTDTLVFPEVGIEVPLTGECTLPAGEVVVDPVAIEFADTYVGATSARTLYIRNFTAADVEVTPVLDPEAPHFSITSGGDPVTLAANASHEVHIAFHPHLVGDHTAVFRAGPDVPDVPLSGTGRYSSAGITIAPPALDFGLRPLGSSTELEVRIVNNNNFAVDMDVALDPDDGPFTLTAGGSVGVLPPASDALIRVLYAPVTEGFHNGWLHLGPTLPPVPIIAQAGDDVPLCGLSDILLEFPLTPTGGGSSLPLAVINTGTAPLILDPSFNCTAFTCVTGPDTLDSGETAELTVLFLPTSVGPYSCALDLGDNMCQPVILMGEAFQGSPAGETEDLVGVYFDEAFTLPFISNLQDMQVFETYLVLKEPSLPDLITGWELRMLVPEGVFLLESQLHGGGISFLAYPDYLVGLQNPLPALPNVHVATFTMFSVGLSSDAPLALVPTRIPSIPDAMAVSSGNLHELRPIFPASGVPVVALLNYTGIVANEALTAEVTGDGSIVLNWPLPSRAGATTRLWRRDPSGREEMLTDAPDLGRGGLLTWTDRPTGFAPGTVLGYSFAVVSGGTEVYRSPRTEVTLPGAVIAATRLLPNVPNPFNPETSVRFELARSGRVRINVYDVAGRRVARLLDESRTAGPGQVAWRGRDDAGRTVTSGAYYIRLEADGRVDTRKVLLLK